MPGFVAASLVSEIVTTHNHVPLSWSWGGIAASYLATFVIMAILRAIWNAVWRWILVCRNT